MYSLLLKLSHSFSNRGLQLRGDDADCDDDDEREEDAVDDGDDVVRVPCVFVNDCNKLSLY